jgi:hypothetical protein
MTLKVNVYVSLLECFMYPVIKCYALLEIFIFIKNIHYHICNVQVYEKS